MTSLRRTKDRLTSIWPKRARSRTSVRRTFLLVAGIFIAAVGYVLFQVPHDIAAGGIGGIALIAGHYSGWPIGLLFWLLNIPMLALGFFNLGRWSFLWRTLFASTLFAVATDGMIAAWPQLVTSPITDNMVLNAIYGGIIGGIGGGLIYRSGATMGGTGVLARVVQRKTGLPLSTVYVIDDGAIIAAMGLVFGWENALFAMLMLFLNGMASDYVLEGPSVTRTATIVTDLPDEVAKALMAKLGHGVTYWQTTGGFTKQEHYMVMCTVARHQVAELIQVVALADSHAFVTIGISHQALGAGFGRLRS